MLSGVSIICFAASYAVTLVLEVTRLFFRSGIRGAVMLGFAGAGLFAHTVYLYYRAVSAAGSPLSSSQDWCLVAAWVLAATYLYLAFHHPRTAFGLYILPLVLGLIGVATFLADPEPYARGPASRVWGAIHGVSILLATVAVLVGFAAGVMYLAQAYRLKHKLPPRRGLRLPSLEWLQRTNSRTIGIALLMLGAGVLSGMVLNLIDYGPETERLPWNDPVVLTTLVMFGWLAACAGIGVFYKPAREGRKVAFLTMLSLVFLVVALAVVLFADTQHGGPRGEGRKQPGERQPAAGSGLRVRGPVFAQGRSALMRRQVTNRGITWGLSRFSRSENGTVPLRTVALRTHGLHPVGSHTCCRSPIVTPCALTAGNWSLSPIHHPSPIPHSLLATPHSPLPTAYCPLPTAHCFLSARRRQA